MKIAGVPDGYELVRIGQAKYLDQYLGAFGDIFIWDEKLPSTSSHVILRKAERQKQYRPFTSAEEFKPHRDRWCMIGDSESRVQNFTQDRVYFRDVKFTWEQAFVEITFDDGSPFGVEVSDED
jgi:hypothetical protein